jgi:putative hydrolase of the HAD superfamily
MIKTIIFDNGGVLVSRNQDGAYSLFATLYGVSERELTREYDEIAKALDEGKITGDEFYHRLNVFFGRSLSFDKIRVAHRAVFNRKQDVWDYAKGLKKNFELALLSNFGDYFDDFNQDWKIEELIDEDKMFVSYRLGMAKPGKEIYEYALNKLGREPEETIFIDDMTQNIETARALGMNVVQFKSVEQLKTEVSEIIKRENER